MLMVVIVHFHLHGLGYITGPVINTSSIGLFNFLTYQFVVIICTVCVNIFVLLSCYFLIGKPFNYARLIKLWVQVVFYAVAIALIAHVIHPEHHGWREVRSVVMFIGLLRHMWGLCCSPPFYLKLPYL